MNVNVWLWLTRKRRRDANPVYSSYSAPSVYAAVSYIFFIDTSNHVTFCVHIHIHCCVYYISNVWTAAARTRLAPRFSPFRRRGRPKPKLWCVRSFVYREGCVATQHGCFVYCSLKYCSVELPVLFLFFVHCHASRYFFVSSRRVLLTRMPISPSLALIFCSRTHARIYAYTCTCTCTHVHILCAREQVRISRGFDRPGFFGFVTFVLPLILDGIFHKAFPKVFGPNTIASLQVCGRPLGNMHALRSCNHF